MLKFTGDGATVVMVFTGLDVGVTVMFGVVGTGGVSCGGGVVAEASPLVKPPASPSKSGGSWTAWKSTVVPKIATRMTWRTKEIVKSRELLNLSISFWRVGFFADAMFRH
jgi:hypothetical protein